MKAPDRVEVLKQFVRRFRPITWNGSRAAIIESNAELLNVLEVYPDPAVVKFVAEDVRETHMSEISGRCCQQIGRYYARST